MNRLPRVLGWTSANIIQMGLRYIVGKPWTPWSQLRLNFWQNLHGLRAVLKIVFLHTKIHESYFRGYSKPFIGMGQMIWRWKAAANPLISHVESFLKFPMVKEEFKKWRNFWNRIAGSYFWVNLKTASPIYANDMALESLWKCTSFHMKSLFQLWTV